MRKLFSPVCLFLPLRTKRFQSHLEANLIKSSHIINFSCELHKVAKIVLRESARTRKEPKGKLKPGSTRCGTVHCEINSAREIATRSLPDRRSDPSDLLIQSAVASAMLAVMTAPGGVLSCPGDERTGMAALSS